jgi:hypothetical protein
MFENSPLPENSTEIVVYDGEPIEFTYKGRQFRIHAVLSSWRESGGWWNRASDGFYRPDDGARAIWRVEAAPIGALTTFEIEREEISEVTGEVRWRIRPSSRTLRSS